MAPSLSWVTSSLLIHFAEHDDDVTNKTTMTLKA